MIFRMYRIEAELLIPGKGEPFKEGCVILENNRISFAGPLEDAPKEDGSMTTFTVPVVMPGMWDCHGHFMGMKTANLDTMYQNPVSVLAGRCVKDAERALQAGFTSIREVGGFGVYIAQLVQEGTVKGPNIYGAGAILSQTAGHADLHSTPLAFMKWLSQSEFPFRTCDGIGDCVQAVREQFRRGASLIKICGSGGVLSQIDHPIHQQFREDELRAMVEEAARVNKIVASHCHGKPGIMASLKAGCHTIEHGTYLDEEAAELMIEQNAILVPTRFIVEKLLEGAEKTGIQEYALKKLRMIAERHFKAMQLAVKMGVTIALGTDIFSSGSDSPVPWGANAQELGYLVKAGMSPLQAIEAATANGPKTLGPEAPKSGQLKEGYDADVIVVKKDPTKNITVLEDNQNITMVWKSGILSKQLSEN